LGICEAQQTFLAITYPCDAVPISGGYRIHGVERGYAIYLCAFLGGCNENIFNWLFLRGGNHVFNPVFHSNLLGIA